MRARSTANVLRSIGDLDRLRDEWESLASQFGSPMLDYDWIVASAKAFHAESELRVVTVSSGGMLSGIAPLAVESTPSGARLTTPGVSRLYEPGGWLFTSREALHELVDEVLRLGHPVKLTRIPADSLMCSELPHRTRGKAVSLIRATSPTFGVDTRGSWESYRGTLSTRVTENLPRLRRRAEKEIGPLQVVRSQPSAADVDGLLDTLVAIEGSGWKERQGSSLSRKRDLFLFFQDYSKRIAARRQLVATTLSFGSRVAAMELAVEAHGRMWQLKIGYEEELGRFYPGLHLVEASIRGAFERGLHSYEFLGSAASWEERWRPDVRTFRLIALYPLNVRGFVGAVRDVSAAVWRKARTRVVGNAAM